MNLVNRILNAGVKDDFGKVQINNYRLSNGAAFLIAIFCIPFVITGYQASPILFTYPSLTLLAYLGVIFLNKGNDNLTARFVLSVAGVLGGSVFHFKLLEMGRPFTMSIFIVVMSLLVMPWVFLSLKERTQLISANIICLLPVFIQLSHIDTLFKSDLKGVDFFQTANMNYISFVISIFILLIASFCIRWISETVGDENAELLSEMEKKNNELASNSQSMETYIEELKIKQKADKKREWKAEGINKVSRILKPGTLLDDVKDELLSTIIKFLGANQGAIYLVNKRDEGLSIDLSACYAYDRKKYMGMSFAPGEGLIGQIYLERDLIYMTDVPENFVKITSGLGDSTPKSLVLATMQHNDEVRAIIELASFEEYDEFAKDFLKEASQMIGSYVANSQINEQTRRLLEETQDQSEQLRQQEEELRQNMEEMTATQEEMQRIKEENEQRIIDLENEIKNYQSAGQVV
ncbi:GAF domain-containing protein [Aureibacter tunicatorum]|uniref:Holliday junction resolvase-like endonuclease n=1 Tax=Aureibacter tunicatorum TaxID=866807 RepID=A0AAE4BTF4_9BACT|nr:GAF domain-containing protein [Aureibacter tunicatorum]MDR6240731.1 putative Holliday junction resolvase-like endonuclease [Aureibacter tunicatorum]BDD06936.1 hypothetical protein AUTU_44190 [Aureibacter tunicatorum]